jgi:hypothetical protein
MTLLKRAEPVLNAEMVERFLVLSIVRRSARAFHIVGQILAFGGPAPELRDLHRVGFLAGHQPIASRFASVELR